MTTTNEAIFDWKISEFLNTKGKRPPYIIIILNQPILRRNIFQILWENAELKICADGGANQLFDAFKGNQERYIPDYIRGDLDSLRDDVRNYYHSKGTEIQCEIEQESTDFMKCINLVRIKEKATISKYDVLAIGSSGGRLDHIMSNIHYLYKLRDERKIFLLSDKNMSFLLQKGKHNILCDREIEGPSCGILPIGVQRATLTTTGLKWNMSAEFYISVRGYD
ncbi:15946_t:CDS:2 [Funneliformis geosporum]|uniref:15946_t:CDS:1 n=1 Tax=Funneliformis geosporum TaxID=1117311 RepID=A0A9W4SLF4_9GLOM|nr:15946_t:CDS:2 [Funneliformis geosporum]